MNHGEENFLVGAVFVLRNEKYVEHATAVMRLYAVYTHGAEIISQMLTCIEEWMHQTHYESISQFKGKLNAANIPNPALYERSQFMKYFSNRD